MEYADCPHCGRHVGFAADDLCPACQEYRTDPVAAIARKSAPPRGSGDMTDGEKVYCGAVIVLAGVMVVLLGMFYFVVIPTMDDARTVNILYFVMLYTWCLLVTLVVTVTINLCKSSLLTVPTVVQAAALILTIYLSPVGIWGFVLWNRATKRRQLAEELQGLG